MRMIEGRARTHAVELLDADKDLVGAHVVGEVWDDACGHRVRPSCLVRFREAHHSDTTP